MAIFAAPAIALVKKYEGFHAVVQRRPVLMAGPYLCPAGVWTIGYGTVVGRADYPPVTEREATQMMLDHLVGDLLAVYRLCPVLIGEPEYRANALASFVYNLGRGRLQASTLRRKVNERDWAGAEEEFHKWVWAGGRKLPGLIARRAEEAAMFAGRLS